MTFVANGPVAFANRLFEAFSIHDLEPAPGVVDEARVLKAPGRHGYSFASPAQHVGNEFLGHDKFVGGYTVMNQEQPSAQAFFERVDTVTSRGQRDLRD